MGQSPPKQLPPTPPPPPVRETGADIAWAKDEERRKQQARRGYQFTMHPQRLMLAPEAGMKKTTLG